MEKTNAPQQQQPAEHESSGKGMAPPPFQLLAADAPPIQRFPDGMGGHRHGGTLPYREATELMACTAITGDAAGCREQVLGERPPLVTPTGGASAAAAPAGGDIDVSRGTAVTTGSGTFYRFAAPGTHTNRTDRPQFRTPEATLVNYTGAGTAPGERIHPLIQGPLNDLMSAMHAEGARIGDRSLQSAVITSSYRPPEESEGRAYLAALQNTITQNATIFGTLSFPSALEAEAISELGFSGSAAHRTFQSHIAAQPGWNADLARQLLTITARFKAPRGGSTHHSGLVVDINFEFALANGTVQMHNTSRRRNAEALRSAAGIWLNTHAMRYGFDSYDTSAEIWHMEYRNWRGTAADPAGPATP